MAGKAGGSSRDRSRPLLHRPRVIIIRDAVAVSGGTRAFSTATSLNDGDQTCQPVLSLPVLACGAAGGLGKA